jgi:F-type H+-transporting ATPase subunit gamma
MPSLKEYRVRIESVKSTRKITSAMKMVAASKLRARRSRPKPRVPMPSAWNVCSASAGRGKAVPVPR